MACVRFVGKIATIPVRFDVQHCPMIVFYHFLVSAPRWVGSPSLFLALFFSHFLLLFALACRRRLLFHLNSLCFLFLFSQLIAPFLVSSSVAFLALITFCRNHLSHRIHPISSKFCLVWRGTLVELHFLHNFVHNLADCRWHHTVAVILIQGVRKIMVQNQRVELKIINYMYQ